MAADRPRRSRPHGVHDLEIGRIQTPDRWPQLCSADRLSCPGLNLDTPGAARSERVAGREQRPLTAALAQPILQLRIRLALDAVADLGKRDATQMEPGL